MITFLDDYFNKRIKKFSSNIKNPKLGELGIPGGKYGCALLIKL